MSSPTVLGIDGGGTKTHAWLANSNGDVLGRGQAGPANAKAIGAAAALAALDEAVEQAFADAGSSVSRVEVACLGLAGFGRPEDQSLLREWSNSRGLAHQLLTVTDGDLVVAAGTPEGWGVGVIAGTGSIAVGRDREGRTARAGGWGHLFGDEGSAYAVVLAALKRVARRADGREAGSEGSDPLTERLCACIGPAATEPMGARARRLHAPGVDRAAIAALAPVVLEAAREDPSDRCRLAGTRGS